MAPRPGIFGTPKLGRQQLQPALQTLCHEIQTQGCIVRFRDLPLHALVEVMLLQFFGTAYGCVQTKLKFGKLQWALVRLT